jgi:hypothetical protein
LKHFIIRTEPTRAHCISWLQNYAIGEPLEVVARPYKAKRSLGQNALYWRTIQEAAHSIGYSADELHEILLGEFFGTREIGFGKTMLRIPVERSKNQNTKKFAEYYEWALSYISQELGVRLAA